MTEVTQADRAMDGLVERLVALSLVCTPGLIVLDGVDIGKELRAMIAAAKEPTDGR